MTDNHHPGSPSPTPEAGQGSNTGKGVKALLRRVLKPGITRFNVHVREEWVETVLRAAPGLGYEAARLADVHRSQAAADGGERIKIQLTWLEQGYVTHSIRQRSDLEAALNRLGVLDPVVDGPIVTTQKMGEWVISAKDSGDAEEFESWAFGAGRREVRYAALTESEAINMFNLACAESPAPVLVRANRRRRIPIHVSAEDPWWGRPRFVALAALLGVCLGVATAYFLDWRVPGGQSSAAVNRSDLGDIVQTQALAAGGVALVGFMTVVLKALLEPLGPGARRSAGTSRRRWAFSLLLMVLSYILMGALFTAITRTHPRASAAIALIIFLVWLLLKILYPVDRPARALSLSTVAAGLAWMGWSGLPNYLLSAGLHLPQGIVQIDAVTRTLVISFLLGPPLLLAIIGWWLMQHLRLESKIGVSALSMISILCCMLSFIAGASFLMEGARQISGRPGVWQSAVATYAIAGANPYGMPDGSVVTVVGDVTDRAVLVVHPCGAGPHKVIAVPAGELRFSPASCPMNEIGQGR